jgi:hypothetical protein
MLLSRGPAGQGPAISIAGIGLSFQGPRGGSGAVPRGAFSRRGAPPCQKQFLENAPTPPRSRRKTKSSDYTYSNRPKSGVSVQGLSGVLGRFGDFRAAERAKTGRLWGGADCGLRRNAGQVRTDLARGLATRAVCRKESVEGRVPWRPSSRRATCSAAAIRDEATRMFAVKPRDETSSFSSCGHRGVHEAHPALIAFAASNLEGPRRNRSDTASSRATPMGARQRDSAGRRAPSIAGLSTIAVLRPDPRTTAPAVRARA